ncbi:MAG TPA: translation initiation factor, partial [Nitrospiraceae bacterium]|nr:translation initiation factor [Nitrospiraceae bacterium]
AAMKTKKRTPMNNEAIAWTNPFAALRRVHPPLPPMGQPDAAPPDRSPPASKKNRGRVDLIRQTAHRGGKTVTVVTGFTGVGPTEIKTIAKNMQKACGAGGTVKEGRIEIQGDQREIVARILANAGFKPVFAGG